RTQAGGGGGGAGANGESSPAATPNVAGDGGAGLFLAWSADQIYVAGGGGGGCSQGGGAGGIGGGTAQPMGQGGGNASTGGGTGGARQGFLPGSGGNGLFIMVFPSSQAEVIQL
ncbi:glycine-rich domain-containing protein, partial [uncultured Paracoccus sp.]|uniref:glycine-rich domain-containing protein n=1 Tax=uncultured Paracoccus sp. TaxID=189685 RepID=UPI0034594AD4